MEQNLEPLTASPGAAGVAGWVTVELALAVEEVHLGKGLAVGGFSNLDQPKDVVMIPVAD